MKFNVTILSEKFKIEETAYHKAKAAAAKEYNAKYRTGKGLTPYPIAFLINLARAEKVVKEPMGRRRKFTDDLVSVED